MARKRTSKAGAKRRPSRIPPAGRLDPLLASLVARVPHERKSDLDRARSAALRPPRPGLRPRAPQAADSVSRLPRGLQSLAVQSSTYATERLKREDRVKVLLLLDDGRKKDRSKLAETIEGWKGEAVPLSPLTLAVTVPRAKLDDLKSEKGVRFVEASRLLKPHLELAEASVHLIDGRGKRRVKETGEGVLIGIVDTGIDANHPAFGGGMGTRIVDYLDQITGREYHEGDIALGRAVASPDSHGHGTHVAGIAAGSGAGHPAYTGVAPGAKLAVVKTTFDTADIAAGIARIVDTADRLEMPCVINLSLGGHFGPHDGSTVLERVIDERSGPGRIVVVSAGNEGADAIHAGTELKKGDERWVADLELNAQLVDGVQMGLLAVQVWIPWEDDLKVELRSPDGELFDAAENESRETDRGTFAVRGTHQRAVASGDHAHTFEIYAVPEPGWLRGWSLVVTPRGKESIQSGSVHAWIVDGAMGRFTSGAVASHLVGMPGTAFSAITVGSYATRDSWPSEDPEFSTASLGAVHLEDVSYFSSPGPTRENHNKPEVAAPGQWVVSALSARAPETVIPRWMRVRGGDYAALQGTSMAAPVVTGAVALLLERRGNLDWAEVRRRIMKSARQDGFTRGTWNPRWGFGKLDIERLLGMEPS